MSRLSLIALLSSAESVLLGGPTIAHDFWDNGGPVPAWVKSQCCGPSDAHHIRISAIHIRPDGYHIDGIKTVVPMGNALPSQDGTYWGFWSGAGPTPYILCFFAPLNGA